LAIATGPTKTAQPPVSLTTVTLPLMPTALAETP